VAEEWQHCEDMWPHDTLVHTACNQLTHFHRETPTNTFSFSLTQLLFTVSLGWARSPNENVWHLWNRFLVEVTCSSHHQHLSPETAKQADVCVIVQQDKRVV